MHNLYALSDETHTPATETPSSSEISITQSREEVEEKSNSVSDAALALATRKVSNEGCGTLSDHRENPSDNDAALDLKVVDWALGHDGAI